MSARMCTFLWAGVAALVCGGCATPAVGPTKDMQRQVGPADEGSMKGGPASGGPTIRSAELDELTRAFADRYVGLLVSTCEAMKKDNPDPAQRREAQDLMLNCATNTYDIASNADAFTRVLDLVVVTTLVSQVWIDDDRAWEVFGDRAEVLVRALHHGRVEAWALAAKVLRPEQLDLMDYLLWDWRRHNPDMVRVAFVRFSNFAIGRGKSANAEVLAAGGLLANVGRAGQAVEEAQLVTERMFYMAKRYPTLLRWQLEAAKDDVIATPEVTKTLADVHRLTEQVEKLPENVAAEREAILAAFDDRNPELRETLAQVKGTIADADALMTSMERTSNSLNETLKTADPLFARFDAWDRWSVELPDYRKFDIRKYTKAVQELAVTVEKMNDVITSSDELLESSGWDRRIEQVNQSADDRMKMASEQSQLLVNEVFRGGCLAIGLLFALLILYRIVTFLLTRRLRSIETEKHDARGEGSK